MDAKVRTAVRAVISAGNIEHLTARKVRSAVEASLGASMGNHKEIIRDEIQKALSEQGPSGTSSLVQERYAREPCVNAASQAGNVRSREEVVLLSSDDEDDQDVQFVKHKQSKRRRTRVAHGKHDTQNIVDLTECSSPPPSAVPKTVPTAPADAASNSTALPAQGYNVRSCAICLDKIRPDSIASTKCGHVFCFDCIKLSQEASKRCPTCRSKLSKKDFHRIFL